METRKRREDNPRIRSAQPDTALALPFRPLLGFLLVVGLFGQPSVAHADGELGLDLEASIPGDVPDANTGLGGGIRLGHEYDLVILSLMPELGADYRAFGGESNAKAFRFTGGGRVGLGFIIQPSVFAHAGVGHFWYDLPNRDVSHTSLAYDLGLALDLTVLPVIDLGAHATWAGIAGNSNVDALSWVGLGGHIEFSFDDSSDD
jgi:hypothetical protein